MNSLKFIIEKETSKATKRKSVSFSQLKETKMLLCLHYIIGKGKGNDPTFAFALT